MAQKPVEIILMRQLASYLAMPIFVVDPAGRLLYYEPAGLLLGRRYADTGEMPLEEWSTTFTPTAEDETPLPGEALPLVIALDDRTLDRLLEEARRSRDLPFQVLPGTEGACFDVGAG